MAARLYCRRGVVEVFDITASCIYTMTVSEGYIKCQLSISRPNKYEIRRHYSNPTPAYIMHKKNEKTKNPLPNINNYRINTFPPTEREESNPCARPYAKRKPNLMPVWCVYLISDVKHLATFSFIIPCPVKYRCNPLTSSICSSGERATTAVCRTEPTVTCRTAIKL